MRFDTRASVRVCVRVCVCVSVAYRNAILYTESGGDTSTHKAKVDLVGQIRKEAKKIEWRRKAARKEGREVE